MFRGPISVTIPRQRDRMEKVQSEGVEAKIGMETTQDGGSTEWRAS
jgi:hypothetical protein